MMTATSPPPPMLLMVIIGERSEAIVMSNEPEASEKWSRRRHSTKEAEPTELVNDCNDCGGGE